jgi:ribosomal protein S18 acetylase RimI-like enzyme
VYTARENERAIKMYTGVGFQELHLPDEQRPEDVHFLYCIH